MGRRGAHDTLNRRAVCCSDRTYFVLISLLLRLLCHTLVVANTICGRYSKESDRERARQFTMERLAKERADMMAEEDALHFAGAHVKVAAGLVPSSVVLDIRGKAGEKMAHSLVFRFDVQQPPRKVTGKNEAFAWVTKELCPEINRDSFESIKFFRPHGSRPCSRKSASGKRCGAQIPPHATMCNKCKSKFDPVPGTVTITVRGTAQKDKVAAHVARHYEKCGVVTSRRSSVLDLTPAERRHRQFVAAVPIRADVDDFSTPDAWARITPSAVKPDVVVMRKNVPMFSLQITNFMPSTSWSKRDLETWLNDHRVKPAKLAYTPEDLTQPNKPCPHIKLTYDDPQTFSRALLTLQGEFHDARYQHSVVFHGKPRTRAPQVKAAPAVDGAVTVRVTMPTGPLADAAATAVLRHVPGAAVECDAVFKVRHVGVFPQVDIMLAHVLERTGVTAVRFVRSPPRVITIAPGHFIGHLLTNNARQKIKYEEKFNVKFDFPKDESKPNTVEGDEADLHRCVQELQRELKGAEVVLGEEIQSGGTVMTDAEIRLRGHLPSQLAAA